MSNATDQATRPPVELHSAALEVQCPMCWAAPGTPCQRHPDGCHIARYCRAYTERRLTVSEATAVFDAAPVIANWIVIEAVTA